MTGLLAVLYFVFWEVQRLSLWWWYISCVPNIWRDFISSQNWLWGTPSGYCVLLPWHMKQNTCFHLGTK